MLQNCAQSNCRIIPKKLRDMKREEICRLLADKVNKLKNKENSLSELLPDVAFVLWRDAIRTYTDDVRCPGIIILFSGHKIGYINERVFRYDANEYLLLTVPLPFECENLCHVRGAAGRVASQCRYFAVTGTVDGHWRR